VENNNAYISPQYKHIKEGDKLVSQFGRTLKIIVFLFTLLLLVFFLSIFWVDYCGLNYWMRQSNAPMDGINLFNKNC